MQKLLTVAVAVLTFGVAGCASVMNGHTQQIAFKSVPSGAQVKLNGLNLCATPCSTEVRRSGDHAIEMSLQGYPSYSTPMPKSVSGYYRGNLVSWYIVGWIADAITGGMWTFESGVVGHVFDPSKAADVKELWAHPERQNNFHHLASLSPEEQDRIIPDLFPEERNNLVEYANGVLSLEWCNPDGSAHGRDVVRVRSDANYPIAKKNLALLKKLCEKGVLPKS